MVRWDEYYQRALGFWRQYRRSWMGISGIVIILFFTGMAFIAPVLSPWPSPVLVNQAPRLSAPLWLMPFDPLGFQQIWPVQNVEFDDNADYWVYNETIGGERYQVVNNTDFDTNADPWYYAGSGLAHTGNIMGGLYRASTGSTVAGGSGPGCYEIWYNDTSTASAYGYSDAYLNFDFYFNESRYPPGIIDRHPSRLFVDYSIDFEIRSSSLETGDALTTFSVELSNSSGYTRIIYSRNFEASAINWAARSREMSQQNITLLFTQSQTMTLSFHLNFRNQIGVDTPDLICRLDDLQLEIQSTYTDPNDNPNMAGEWTGTTGSNFSGPGSYLFTYLDTDDTAAFIGSSAWVQQNFTWDFYDRPKEAFTRYTYKVESDGPFGDAFINLRQECYVVSTGHTEVILQEDNIISERDWTPSPEKVWDTFMITNTFEQRGTLWVRLRVLISDPTPEDTPSFQIYVDDLSLEVKGSYYGNLGAGQFGEDLWAQLLWGSRIALVVGLTAAFISTFVGLIVGLIAGYFGGLIDEVLMRVTDFFLIIPGLPLMIVLAAILTPHWWNIVLVIALIGWTGTARLVRSQVLAERARAYVEAARAIGASDLYIIFRHVLPNVTPLLFAQITLGVAGAVLLEASLSFLGLTHPTDVSWGRMLNQASQAGAYSEGAWWYVFFPGLCIVLLAMSWTLVGYAIDEILNPRLRIRRQ